MCVCVEAIVMVIVKVTVIAVIATGLVQASAKVVEWGGALVMVTVKAIIITVAGRLSYRYKCA